MTVKLPISPIIPLSFEERREFVMNRYFRDINFIRSAMDQLKADDTLYVIGPGQSDCDLRFLENRPYEANEAMRLLYDNYCLSTGKSTPATV